MLFWKSPVMLCRIESVFRKAWRDARCSGMRVLSWHACGMACGHMQT